MTYALEDASGTSFESPVEVLVLDSSFIAGPRSGEYCGTQDSG